MRRAEQVVREGRVRPAMLQHRADVFASVHQQQQRPLQRRGGGAREERRVRPQLRVQSRAQLLRHRLGG